MIASLAKINLQDQVI